MQRRSARVLILTLSLGVAGAFAGGIAIFFSTAKLYTSTGVILVQQPQLQTSLNTESASIALMFDAYVGSQVELVRSQQVCDEAIQELASMRQRVGYTVPSIAEFRRNMEVHRSNDNQAIVVSFTDSERHYAEDAVTAIIGAYLKVFGNIEVRGSDQATKELNEEHAALTEQLSVLGDKIDVLGQDEDIDAINRKFALSLQDLHRYETDLKEAKLGLDLDPALPDPDRSNPSTNEISSDELNRPEHMQRLQTRYDELKAQTQELSRKKRQIEQINEEIGHVRDRIEQTKLLLERQSAKTAWRGDFEVTSDNRVRTEPTRTGARLAMTGAAGGFLLCSLVGVAAARFKSRSAP